MTDLQITRHTATLRTQVEDRLRRAIADGVFRPGERLIERDLCERLGVGRTSVREALRQLEAEGLVTTYPHRGPVVSSLTVEEATELYAIRAVNEGYAGRLFASRHEPTEVDALRRAYDQLEAATRLDDAHALVQAKNDFYTVLLEGSGNRYMVQILKMLHNRINLLRVTSMTQPGRMKHSLQEIRRICSAIEAGDADEAEKACIAHIEAASKVALQVLAAREQAVAGAK